MRGPLKGLIQKWLIFLKRLSDLKMEFFDRNSALHRNGPKNTPISNCCSGLYSKILSGSILTGHRVMADIPPAPDARAGEAKN